MCVCVVAHVCHSAMPELLETLCCMREGAATRAMHVLLGATGRVPCYGPQYDALHTRTLFAMRDVYAMQICACGGDE